MTDGALPSFDTYTDADFKRTIRSALRIMAILLAIALPVLYWKLGWRAAAMMAVGAAVSGSGLFEWLRLMSAFMARMDVAFKPKPVAPVLIGFFFRLLVAVAALYGSLKLVDGSGSSIAALAAGLALGVISLSLEGLKLIKSWT